MSIQWLSKSLALILLCAFAVCIHILTLYASCCFPRMFVIIILVKLVEPNSPYNLHCTLKIPACKMLCVFANIATMSLLTRLIAVCYLFTRCARNRKQWYLTRLRVKRIANKQQEGTQQKLVLNLRFQLCRKIHDKKNADFLGPNRVVNLCAGNQLF